MTRGTLVTYAIIGLLLMFAGQNLLHQLGAYKERIKAAETERKALVVDRDRLRQKVEELGAAQTRLQGEIQTKETALTTLRHEVTDLKSKLQDERSEIVRIQSDDDSMVRFAAEFPQFSEGMRLVERQVESKKVPGRKVPVNYIMLPVGFVDHFIDLKKTARGVEQQNFRLERMDALNVEVKEQQAQILRLEQEKTAAYHEGYEHAFAKYMELSERYIALMKEKRYSVGTSLYQSIGAFIGGAALGTRF